MFSIYLCLHGTLFLINKCLLFLIITYVTKKKRLHESHFNFQKSLCSLYEFSGHSLTNSIGSCAVFYEKAKTKLGHFL